MDKPATITGKSFLNYINNKIAKDFIKEIKKKIEEFPKLDNSIQAKIWTKDVETVFMNLGRNPIPNGSKEKYF